MRWMAIFFAAMALSILHAAAQDLTVTSIGGLPEIELSKLSQSDPNPLGEKALAIHPEQWKHAETEHFIYHFVHGYVATPVSVEAEFHYRVVTKELERDRLSAFTDVKSHIYIFENPEDWHEFQVFGKLEPWTGAIHSQGSLFVQRNPKFKFTNNSLGHEIVHLVLHRFYTSGIPCWLDEGFAQYASKAAHASYQRARGYIARPTSQFTAAENYIPLKNLLGFTFPPTDNVEGFYNESERLVRFLAATDKPGFLSLLDALARHQPFEIALSRFYAGKFPNTVVLEEKFREYASKDFGSAAQQASVE